VNVAVLTLTRDRLDYTKHCLETLERNAGCEYDHYILDQGSQDGTVEWLRMNTKAHIYELHENIGICRGLNFLLEEFDPIDYDAIVRWDNDCEVLSKDALLFSAWIANEYEIICSPLVHGLRNPPGSIGELQAGPHRILETEILGGIFMAIPSTIFYLDQFRYDFEQPLWKGDELICPWWRARAGHCGYVADLEVNHYLTTEGQGKDMPDYFLRRVAEGGPAL
jgi:GT2 family glycosyltransferase